MMLKRLSPVLLVATLLILAPRAAHGAPAGPPILDRWRIEVNTGPAEVELLTERWLTISDATQSALLRGAPLYQPEALEAALLVEGAAEADCRLEDHGESLTIYCATRHRLAAAGNVVSVPGPTAAILAPIFSLPVEAAVAVSITTEGTLMSTHPLAGIPWHYRRTAGDGESTQRIRLVSLRGFRLYRNERWPAGTLPTGATEENFVRVWRHYDPIRTAWWLWGLALVAGIGLVYLAFPTRAHWGVYGDEPRPPHNQAAWWLRPLVRFIEQVRRWLLFQWPQIFLSFYSLALFVVGAGLIGLAWVLAALLPAAGAARQRLGEWWVSLPLAFGWRAGGEPEGWALLLLLLGAGACALGIGLGLRREWARLGVTGLHLAAFLLLVSGWPGWLLSPPLMPGQPLIFWLVGMATALALAALIRTGQHPAVRRACVNAIEGGEDGGH